MGQGEISIGIVFRKELLTQSYGLLHTCCWVLTEMFNKRCFMNRHICALEKVS